MAVTVSVITATWNCKDTVVDCVKSVLSQSWRHVEHIVVDGASTDGTVAELSKFSDSFAWFSSETDAGIYDALNKGIRRVTGDIVGFLHADDVFARKDVLEEIASSFDDPGVDAVYGDLEYVRRDNLHEVVRYWRPGRFSRSRLEWGWMPPHPTLYVRRKWYDKIGGFDERYRIAADYFSILRLFGSPSFNAIYVPQTLVKMRIGGASNRSLRNLVVKSREDLDALHRAGVGALGGYGALFWKNASKVRQFVIRRNAT